MSILIPLSVRLSSSRSDIHVTRQVRDLAIRWTDPGGYQSCRVSLDRPLTLQPDEIAYYGNLVVYDARDGSVVFDGRLEDPGRSAGNQGEVWDLVAVGGQAHTRDRIVPYVIIDQPLSGLERVDNVNPGANDSVGADPGDAAGLAQAIILQFPQGLGVNTNSRVAVRYNSIYRAGQKLARLTYLWDAGVTDANHATQAITRTDGNLATGETAATAAFNIAGGTSTALIITNFPSGRNTVEVRQIRTAGGASTIPSDLYWASVRDLTIQATRYTASGSELLTAADYPQDYVLASQVVADLLGRLLTAYDGANATIATTTHQIQQLAYLDGVDVARVLEDLLALESGFTWRVWERNSAGKYRFEFVPVPSQVRYEADLSDGYDSQGSADGLYNRVTVLWRDSGGHIRTTERTATVPLLDNAPGGPLIRQGRIDLGSSVGLVAAAERAGDQWLADRTNPPNAGRLRIARPILDIQTGMMVMPWEIRPGLIRVRGILPRPDALNATARDGVTVFRIAASEYSASAAAATLELDSSPPSTARMLADVRQLADRVTRT